MIEDLFLNQQENGEIVLTKGVFSAFKFQLCSFQYEFCLNKKARFTAVVLKVEQSLNAQIKWQIFGFFYNMNTSKQPVNHLFYISGKNIDFCYVKQFLIDIF